MARAQRWTCRLGRGRWLCQNHRLSHTTHSWHTPLGCHQPHHTDTLLGTFKPPSPCTAQSSKALQGAPWPWPSLEDARAQPSARPTGAAGLRALSGISAGSGRNAAATGTMPAPCTGPLRDEAGSSCLGTALHSRSRQEADGDDTGGRFLRQDAAGFLRCCSRCRASGAGGPRAALWHWDPAAPPSPAHGGPLLRIVCRRGTQGHSAARPSCPALPVPPGGSPPPQHSPGAAALRHSRDAAAPQPLLREGQQARPEP